MHNLSTTVIPLVRFSFPIFMRGLLLLWLILSINFVFLRLMSGSPLEGDPPLTESMAAQKVIQLGLDRPIITQYLIFMQAVGRGNWGNSLVYTTRPITTIIAEAWPRTLFLGFSSFLLALCLGTGLALLTHQRTMVGQKLSWFFIFVINSLPSLAIGPLFVWFFSFKLGWLPSMGWLKESTTTLILPLLTLSLPFAGTSARLLAKQLSTIKTAPFTQNMHSLGLTSWSCQIKQLGPSLLLPIVHISALVLSQLLMGSIVVEKMFHIPGMGMIFLDAIKSRDYPLVQALITLYTILLILINGLAYALIQQLDPRLIKE